MERWKSLVALTVVGALAAGPAWAQTSTPSSTDKGTTGTSGSMQKDKAGSTDKGKMGAGGSASGSTGMEKDKAAGDKTGRGEMKADKGMKGARGGNKDQVKAAQQALKDKGHDPGSIDGVMGPKTKAALKDFQKKEGLKESGQLDSETMAKLDMKTSSAGGSAPSASPATGSGQDAAKDKTSSSGQDASKSSASGQDASKSSPSASPSTGSGQDAAKPGAGQDPTKKQ